ncbi:MAG: hypothetical protein AAGN64_00260 [Bacteroidota bacterium]
MERNGNTTAWRGWVIVEGGRAAWENRVRPDHGFVFDVKARRARLRVE